VIFIFHEKELIRNYLGIPIPFWFLSLVNKVSIPVYSFLMFGSNWILFETTRILIWINFMHFIVYLNGTKLHIFISKHTRSINIFWLIYGFDYSLFSTWHKQILIRYKKRVICQKWQFLIGFFQIKFWSSEKGYIQNPKRQCNSIVFLWFWLFMSLLSGTAFKIFI
jgi:hypothetical protein